MICCIYCRSLSVLRRAKQSGADLAAYFPPAKAPTPVPSANGNAILGIKFPCGETKKREGNNGHFVNYFVMKSWSVSRNTDNRDRYPVCMQPIPPDNSVLSSLASKMGARFHEQEFKPCIAAYNPTQITARRKNSNTTKKSMLTATRRQQHQQKNR